MLKKDLIPCLIWVKKGVSKNIPDKVEINEEELKQIIEEAKGNVENYCGQKKSKFTEDKYNNDDDLKKYNLDGYDEEDDTAEPSLASLVYYANNKEDPFIDNDDDDDSDLEDFTIKPSDNLIVVGRVQKNNNSLDVYVYNNAEDSFYCHHDIFLSSFPLCVEWLNFDPSDEAPGNFVAVGSVKPAIEIWDLDIVDSLEPAFTLGTNKKNKKQSSTVNSHTDAVLDLSWNKHVRNVLASASADFTVALWDMNEGKIVSSLKQHIEKVQSLEWHPCEAQTLLTGSFDKTVKVFDCRSSNDGFKSWEVDGEVEKVLWNHFEPLYFLVGTDTGFIHYFDVRAYKPVFTLSAHSSSVTGIALNHQLPGCLITTSSDKSLKIWDIQDNIPEFVVEKFFKMGELMCCKACPDSPSFVAIGGQKPMKNIKIWDIKESAEVMKRFQGRSWGQTSINIGSSQKPVAMDITKT